MTIDRSRYKEVDPKKYIRYTHPGHDKVDPALSGRSAKLCEDRGQTLTSPRGFVTSAGQKAVGDLLLSQHPECYRDKKGAVRRKVDDFMMASPPGESNHEFAEAIDYNDAWFKALTNKDLLPYGLFKPYPLDEPWHTQCIETKGIPKSEIKQYFLNGGRDMGAWEERAVEFVKTFQAKMGLTIDGKAGVGTCSKLDELFKNIDSMENDIRVARGALDKY